MSGTLGRCRSVAGLVSAAIVASTGLAAEADVKSRWSWQQPHAEVVETGDLQWAPRTFEFKAGESVRYIDFDGGDDANDGASRDSPWKHHPWDPNATGNAAKEQGVHTYVFKRGVNYRGTLNSDESGKPDDPIRLTSDPEWGDGEATLVGSRQITGGWTRADAESAPGFPEPEKVWYIDLDKSFYPRAVWETRGDQIIRIPLARDPNWTISNPEDVKSEWYTWKHSDTEIITNADGNQTTKAWPQDPERLTESDPDAFKGATVWTEYVSVMGQPYPAPVEKYDPERNAIRVGGPWGDAGHYRPIWMNRYYLENLPRFLDSAGEYYYAAEGPHAGRLYVRLPEDRDPNSATIEVADRMTQIDIRDRSHIEISGLSFRFGNVPHWYDRWWTIAEEDPAGVKALGNCSSLRIANCSFEHLPMPIFIKAQGENAVMDAISVTDNDIAHTDYAGIEISAGGGREKRSGVLKHVDVLRNRITEAGMRPRRAAQGHTLTVEFPETAEIAGNVLHRTGGAGLFIFGGKGGGQLFDVPLSRILVHHNKVTDPLVITNDYGGIETWQGGPFYVYNNVSGNPGGYWHFSHMAKKDKPEERGHATARFGFAYYFDGSFKNYVFNNIAWGKSNDLNSPLAATTAFHEVIGVQNTFANNTAHKFVASVRRQAPQGGRGYYLGNIFSDATEVFLRHSDVDRPQDVNLEKETSSTDKAYDTLAYTNNIFFGNPRHFGHFELHGPIHKTLEQFQEALKNSGALAWQTGWNAEKPPLAAGDEHDFRPSGGSAAIDRGVKHFVPWGLYATAGEWHFYKHPADPSVVLDDSWYMTDRHQNRDMYRHIPRMNLKGVNITEADFVDGVLENWTQGALKLNGKDQHLEIPHQRIAADWEWGDEKYKGAEARSLDMGTNNFIIEAYFRAAQGSQAGIIVSKMSESGYALGHYRGGPMLVLLADQKRIALHAHAEVPVNDGNWHHVLAEVDRVGGVATLYVDGKPAARRPLTYPRGLPLSNTADFLVGKAPTGEHFAGEIEFLRISRGSLADARTTIEELYAWQFDGPFLRDFAGHEPQGRRDAGALEARP